MEINFAYFSISLPAPPSVVYTQGEPLVLHCTLEGRPGRSCGLSPDQANPRINPCRSVK